MKSGWKIPMPEREDSVLQVKERQSVGVTKETQKGLWPIINASRIPSGILTIKEGAFDFEHPCNDTLLQCEKHRQVTLKRELDPVCFECTR